MNTLKTIKLFALAILFIGLNSCNSDDEENQQSGNLEAKRIENFEAPGDVMDFTTNPPTVAEVRPFRYFSFSEGIEVEETANWDIAFKGSLIKVNGGVSGDAQAEATVVTGIFNEIDSVPDTATFNTDVADTDSSVSYAIPYGSGNGWYTFNMDTHLYSPIPGKVILIKTHDGKYAKMEILSYYKDLESTIVNGGYYTFNYVYQPDGSVNF